MKDAIIRAEALRFSYTSAEGVAPVVLDGVDLSIQEGTFVAVLGHNGSGKSTLAKHMNAILLPSGGKVYVDGIDTVDEDRLLDIRRTVGMVFQNPDTPFFSSSATTSVKAFKAFSASFFEISACSAMAATNSVLFIMNSSCISFPVPFEMSKRAVLPRNIIFYLYL